jgi:hypothetical protein
VKGTAVLSALLILLRWDAWAADDIAGAVGELARKTVALAGRGEPVSVSWRNLSPLASGDFNEVRSAFEAALCEAGVSGRDWAGLSHLGLMRDGESASIPPGPNHDHVQNLLLLRERRAQRKNPADSGTNLTRQVRERDQGVARGRGRPPHQD